MTKKKLFAALFLLSLILTACSSAAPAPPVMAGPGNLPQTQDDVPRVTVEEARLAFESGAAVIVDVRAAEVYAIKHIRGALSIPLEQIEANPTGVGLDKNQWIITYCT